MGALVQLTADNLRLAVSIAEGQKVPPKVVPGLAVPVSSVEAAIQQEIQDAADEWLEEDILTPCCDRVVMAINSCTRNARIATGLRRVPAACVDTVLALAVYKFIATVPGVTDDTLEGSPRQRRFADAVKQCEMLASCELLPSYSLRDGEEEQDPSRGGIGLVTKHANKWMS